jgi:uncharacterized membrane protein YcjF (UPF0283 family)
MSIAVVLPWTTEIGARRMYRGTYSSAFSSASRRRRRFRRLGILAAAIVMTIGIAIVAAGVVRLELWMELQHDTLAIVLGFTLIALVAVCLAVYLLVRVIGWVIGGLAA